MADNQVVKVLSVDITSGATLSAALDLVQGWSEAAVAIGTFASATDVYFHAATTSDGTYRRVAHPIVNTGTAELNDWKIESGIAARVVPLPIGYQFVKFELSTGQTDTTTTLDVICKS